MATFYSWNSTEKSEQGYSERIRNQKPSSFDRIIAGFAVAALLVLSNLHFDNPHAAPDRQVTGSIGPAAPQIHSHSRWQDKSPYGMSHKAKDELCPCTP